MLFRSLATLGPGALFGETALLTGAPRNSTVRAVHGALVLRMDGADLLELMRNDQPVADSLWRLTAERARPAQAATATASHDPAQGGDATLTDTRTGAQFRLSPFGFSIWQQLDGERTARDISVNLFEQTGVLAPLAVQHVMLMLLDAGLASAGVELPAPAAPTPQGRHGNPWLPALAIALVVIAVLAVLLLRH